MTMSVVQAQKWILSISQKFGIQQFFLYSRKGGLISGKNQEFERDLGACTSSIPQFIEYRFFHHIWKDEKFVMKPSLEEANNKENSSKFPSFAPKQKDCSVWVLKGEEMERDLGGCHGFTVISLRPLSLLLSFPGKLEFGNFQRIQVFTGQETFSLLECQVSECLQLQTQQGCFSLIFAVVKRIESNNEKNEKEEKEKRNETSGILCPLFHPKTSRGNLSQVRNEFSSSSPLILFSTDSKNLPLASTLSSLVSLSPTSPENSSPSSPYFYFTLERGTKLFEAFFSSRDSPRLFTLFLPNEDANEVFQFFAKPNALENLKANSKIQLQDNRLYIHGSSSFQASSLSVQPFGDGLVVIAYFV